MEISNAITKLSPGVHDQNRVNVFINDKFSFSLNLAQVVDFKLKVGKVLTDEDLEKYKKASEFGKLYQRTLEWVLTRPRSEKETRDYLKRKRLKREVENRQIARDRARRLEERLEGHSERKYPPKKELPLFSDEDVEAIISRLQEKNYLNDENFARFYLENRNVSKGASVKKLRLELLKKGVDKNLIDSLFAENLRNDDEEIKKIIAKKRHKYDDEHLLAYLVRQGFSYDDAKNAIDLAKDD